MIRFIHTADIHFGMENYGRIDAKTGLHTRLLDFERALNFCVDYAIAQEVDFFLFAGDAYKTAHPTPTHQRLLTQCLFRLYKAAIPVVIIVGNHDHPVSFGKSHALDIFSQLPLEGFHVIAKPTQLTLTTKHGPVQIVGIPWPTRATIALKDTYTNPTDISGHISKGVTKIIRDLASRLDPSLPAVLAGHLTVSSGIFSGSEKRAIYGTDPLFLPSDLAISPFDYVALGHLHRFQVVNPGGYPPILYSGSLERIDFGERKEEKGFCLVQLHNKQHTTYEFIKTPTRPFIQIEVYLEDTLNQTEQILEQLKKYPIAQSILKIIYHVPATKRDRVDIAAIQQACASALYITGIIPIRAPLSRERRPTLKVDMDLRTLLQAYLATKPEHAHNQETLLKKALELESELFEQDII